MIHCTTRTIYRYSGLSTDTKPTKDVKDASEFWETDTQCEFEWRNNDWFPRNTLPLQYDLANYDGTDPLYIGSVARGGQWKIEKFSSSTQKMENRTGVSGYLTNWTNRISLFT